MDSEVNVKVRTEYISTYLHRNNTPVATVGKATQSLRLNELEHWREFAAFSTHQKRYAFAFETNALTNCLNTPGEATQSLRLNELEHWREFAALIPTTVRKYNDQ
jgi:hypothetical protein